MAPWICTLLLDFLLICGWENINVMQLSEGKYDLEVAKMIGSDWIICFSLNIKGSLIKGMRAV
jgi:hypothetical protein